MDRLPASRICTATAGVLVLGATLSAACRAERTGTAAGRAGPATAAIAGQEVTFTLPGDVPLVLVRIPAGTFLMGSPVGERNRDDDETQHRVTLTRDYYLGKYELTQAQWQAITGSNPSYFSSDPDSPVEQVSWNDVTRADGFLASLNRHLAATGQAGAGRMRLPTEAEWERAARGGTNTRFSYGDALECADACRPCAIHSRNMWWCGDQPGRPARVGGKQPNQFGVYDMHGNVWEWVADRYGPYGPSPQTDPAGPAKGSDRVVRGGGSEVPLPYSRAAARRVRPADDRWAHTGLRVAMSP